MDERAGSHFDLVLKWLNAGSHERYNPSSLLLCKWIRQ
jgi:hypothetical protein